MTSRSRTLIEGRIGIGTRIHYTGDMANRERFGVITAEHPADRWGGVSWDMTCDMDDEDEAGPEVWEDLDALHFAPGPGTRFFILPRA